MYIMNDIRALKCKVLCERPLSYLAFGRGSIALPKEVCEIIDEYAIQAQLRGYTYGIYEFVRSTESPPVRSLNDLRTLASQKLPSNPVISWKLYDSSVNSVDWYMFAIRGTWSHGWNPNVVELICPDCHLHTLWKKHHLGTGRYSAGEDGDDCTCGGVTSITWTGHYSYIVNDDATHVYSTQPPSTCTIV